MGILNIFNKKQYKLIDTKVDRFDVVKKAKEALKSSRPKINDIYLEQKLGYCQRAIRQLIEGYIWNDEFRWNQSSCCATSSFRKLVNSGYQIKGLNEISSGDLVYVSTTGKKCGTCGNTVGHVMMATQKLDVWYMWQNTSYKSKGLCNIPLRKEQMDRILGVVKIFK